MPQLDINTFTFQYVSLITVFLTSYAVLTYLVLPLTLRALLIRSYTTTLSNLLFPSTYIVFGGGVKKVSSLLNNMSLLNLLVVKEFNNSYFAQEMLHEGITISSSVQLNYSYVHYIHLISVIDYDND